MNRFSLYVWGLMQLVETAQSAFVTTLNPASYTAIVRGAHGTTGVALVEVYTLR